MKFKSNDENKRLTLRETQKISLEILKLIASICEQNNIRYYLMFGTLLGAIRHKGFIPWDDDIDIMMPRPDYDKFCVSFKEYESKHPPYQIV
jgi:lipopolysaccharide cholinephosphotransferase